MAGGKRQAKAKTKKNAPAKAVKGSKAARSASSKPVKNAKTAKSGSRNPARPATKAARPTTNRTTASASRSSAGPRAAGPAEATLDRLHQVAMTATNLDASVVFYRDTLGLRFIARFDPPGLAFFNLGGGVRLMLSATSSSATLYFLVDDLKAAFREFNKRGVHFLQPPALIHRDEAGDFGRRGGEEWMAFFRDPCGNMLALVERR